MRARRWFATVRSGIGCGDLFGAIVAVMFAACSACSSSSTHPDAALDADADGGGGGDTAGDVPPADQTQDVDVGTDGVDDAGEATDGGGGCTPWAPVGTDGCGAGEWCRPDIHAGGDPACVPIAGTAAVGGRCNDLTPATTCGAGLSCEHDRLGAGYICMPYCAVAAAAGAPGATCGADQLCDPITGDDDVRLAVGTCVNTECTPWATGVDDRCDEVSWCEPWAESIPGDGSCMPTDGLVPEYGACDQRSPETRCRPGLACFDDWCWRPCAVAAAPDAPGATCAAHEICAAEAYGWRLDAYRSWVGVCNSTDCTPWVDPTAGGCPPGDWCQPLLWAPDAGGLCRMPGVVDVDGACDSVTPSTSCAAGLECVGGQCTRVCEVDAAPGTPSHTCAADEACFPSGDAFHVAAPLGYCIPSCDFHGGITCTNPGASCLMGELVSEFVAPYPWPPIDICVTLDVVLDPGADCTAAGLDFLSFCGPNAVCRPDASGDGLFCTDLCVPTPEHPFDAPGHPDCRDPGATCTDDGFLLFGICA